MAWHSERRQRRRANTGQPRAVDWRPDRAPALQQLLLLLPPLPMPRRDTVAERWVWLWMAAAVDGRGGLAVHSQAVRPASLRRACFPFARPLAGWLALRAKSTPSAPCVHVQVEGAVLPDDRHEPPQYGERVRGHHRARRGGGLSGPAAGAPRNARPVPLLSLASAAPVTCEPPRWAWLAAGVLAEPQEPDTWDVVLRSWRALPDQPEHAAVRAIACLLRCVCPSAPVCLGVPPICPAAHAQ
eukprot:COSAG02_NODE_203_length_29261_cov_20.960395_11_plen_242_part_00